MTRRTRIAIAFGATAALVAAMAYGSSRAQHFPPPTKAEATLVAETMLVALNEGDYATFSSEFSPDMLNEMDRQTFSRWRAPLIAETGDFVEITTIKKVTASNPDATRYVFRASFENDDSVQFAIVFAAGTQAINRIELKPDK
jgi:hypothetical protein